MCVEVRALDLVAVSFPDGRSGSSTMAAAADAVFDEDIEEAEFDGKSRELISGQPVVDDSGEFGKVAGCC